MGTWIARNTGLDQPQNTWWLASGMPESRVVAAYQPLGAATIAASYVNLVDPGTFNASPVVAPTFATATGWTFTGTQHLTTNITGTGLQTYMVRMVYDHVATPRGGIIGYDEGAGAKQYIEIDFNGVLNNFVYNGYNNAELRTSTVISPQESVVALARNEVYTVIGTVSNNTGTVAAGLAQWNTGTITIAKEIVSGSSKYQGVITAISIYNDQLSQSEIEEIGINMLAVTSSDNPITTPWAVNYIVQNPATRRLNSTSHELWIATDGGVFHTLNGGRSWAQINLPDPSNAEFSDSPAATVSELTFHWVDYDPTDELTLYVYGAKASTSRIWIYKTTDLGLNWTSRGVVTA